MDELIENYESLKDGWDNLNDFITYMNGRNHSVVSYLQSIYGPPPAPNAGRTTTEYINRIAAVVDRMNDERARQNMDKINLRSENAEASLWELYNGVQGYTQHTKTRKTIGGKQPNAFDKALMANGILGNDKDSVNAEKMNYQMYQEALAVAG